MLNHFPLSPQPANRHLVHLLRERIEKAPHSPLLTQGAKNFTAEDLLNSGAGFAKAFAAAGLRSGDRVALQSTNRPEFISVLVGCALTGLILVPVNTASRGSQLAYYIKNSRARIFITENELLAHITNARVADSASVDGLEAIWSLDDCAANADLPQLIPFSKAAIAESSAAYEPHSTDPAVVIYTSGTSGPSKGVICSHAQLFWWGQHSLQNIGIDASDVLYTCLPLFHINALNTFFQALQCGGRIVVGGKFSVSRFFSDLISAEATVTFLLGAMVPMLLSREPDASERAHRVRVALAPGASAQHYEQFVSRTGIQVLDGFGSTETNFVICTPHDDPRPGWMGKVARGFEARVVDEFDNEVPHGTPGELILRNDEPFAFSSGYFDMPEKTGEAWRNLWFHTGDRVLRDVDGYYRFLDRMKDSIRRRGENISSYEVEQVVNGHPAVAEVAAYAVPSELAEDEVMCSIILRDGEHLDPLELIKWIEPRLPYFAIPRFLRILKELPKTENGKVQKYKLRAEGRTSDTWDLASSGHVIKR
ncbi:ATP-dependent acyl-CoA ligase [Comamonas sp. F1-6]|uniref:ATP-dependent acyl-CoA ligase n=1 Tax=Comamonas sp. F1-6 TaxID=673550 RepID=UPI0031D80A42